MVGAADSPGASLTRFDSRTQRLMCVEFVVGSLPAPRGFPRAFLSLQTPTLLNSNSIWTLGPPLISQYSRLKELSCFKVTVYLQRVRQ